MQTAEGPRKVHYNAFGPYRLARTIGQGEFGKVKLAYHIRTNKEIAIKLIKKENIQNPTRREKLIREIDILKSINHHHVVKLYEVIETEGYIGMVMEFASGTVVANSGGELFEHILARTYLKDFEAANFFAQLLVGVSFLHDNGIVHRDLKLENLLLDKNKKIIITDFGFANRFSRGGGKEYLSTSCGSPCYAAPELVVNDCYVGESADIWSCGVILYAMLCGYLPFDDEMANAADSVNKLYQYILEAKLDYPPHVRSIPKHLISIILVTDPKLRANMQQMKQHPFLQDFRHLFIDPKTVKPKTSDSAIVPDVVNNSNVPLVAPIPVKTPFFGAQPTVPMNSSLDTVVENFDAVKLQEPSPTNSIAGGKFEDVKNVEPQPKQESPIASPQSREKMSVPEPATQESTTEPAKSSKEQPKEKEPVAVKSQSDEKLARPQSKSKRISRTLSREDMPRSSDLLKNNLIASKIKEEKSQEKLEKLRQSLEKLEKLKVPEIPQEPELPKDFTRAKSVDQPRSYSTRGETQSFKEFVKSTYGRKSSNNTRAHLKSDMGVAFPFTTTELERMKHHSGPIDHRALSSASASELLVKIVKVLNEMGFEVLYTDDPYKLKAVRQGDEHIDDHSNSESDFAESNFSVGRSVVSTAPSTRLVNANPKVPQKKSKIGNVLASFPFSLVQSIKNVGQFGLQYNRGYDGKPLPGASAAHVPSEKKLKFYVMVHKIRNLDGLLTVDLKRYRGDIWEFKKLYHEFITLLNLKVENK
ncbi:hypothetical protein HDV01_002480 [Terramyces sp. JEL0728]|nr:hypothetical protein HDV01_002480 [Terramyces sp. JEL0728]